MARIASNTSNLNPVEKANRGLTLITMGTDNPQVPGNQAAITSFAAVNTSLQNINQEIAVLRDQLHDKITARNAIEEEWDTEVNSLAGVTYSITGGNPVAVESAGFTIVRPPSKPQPLPAPLDLRVATNGTPGVSKLSWKRVRGAVAYLVEFSLDGVTWSGPTTATKTRVELPGAEPGKVCYFRVCAVNAEGPGPWSVPIPRPVM